MTLHFAHHVPGRLRVKFPPMKGDPARAGALQELLRSCDGVRSVSANTVTGSIVVTYDVSLVAGMEILRRLRSAGYDVSGEAPSPALPAAARPSPGDRILKSVVETIVERSAIALITALI